MVERSRLSTRRRGLPTPGNGPCFATTAAATDQPALPTTLNALTGFLTQIPALGTTPARRVSAIVAAHRNAGYLLQRPPTTHSTATRPFDARPDSGQMIESWLNRRNSR